MITVDKEFEALIPPLSVDEYTQLEKNIVKEGIRDPLVVWKTPDGKEILLDGHNRWKISAAHSGIRFNVAYKEFKTRAEAEQWIILNQFGRRNLSAYDRSVLALKLKPLIAEKAKEKQSEAGGALRQKSDKAAINTRKELAKVAGVSHDTIHKVEKIEKEATERTKQLVRQGDLSINQAYNGLFPKRPDPVERAKEAHTAFEEQKKEAVVDFKAAKLDKINQDIIASGLHHEILAALGKIDAILISHKATDVTEMSKALDDEERDRLIRDCQWTQKNLMTIMSALIID